MHARLLHPTADGPGSWAHRTTWDLESLTQHNTCISGLVTTSPIHDTFESPLLNLETMPLGFRNAAMGEDVG